MPSFVLNHVISSLNLIQKRLSGDVSAFFEFRDSSDTLSKTMDAASSPSACRYNEELLTPMQCTGIQICDISRVTL